ncbi:MAG: gliding motility-associated C-terminal domain-containing protein [Crocinitomicaceae bacterium]|jgi:gliding motility-associated-like protein|nr:gliding motility-associated C-terminal domain-containing protein [Crocinitomicaceae bacterium]
MKKVILLSVILINYSLLFAQTPAADFSADQTTICAGGTVNFTDLSTNAITWAWSFSSAGTPSTSSAQNPSVTYNTPGTYQVVLVVTSATFESDVEVKNAYITVLANASITLTSAVGTDAQTICANSPLTDIEFEIQAASGVSVTGSYPTGVSGTFVPSATGGTYTVSGTPTAAGSYPITIQTTGGGCAPQVYNFTIEVTNPHSLALTSAAGTDNQMVCNGSAMTPIQYTYGGGATSVLVTGLPTGVSFVDAAGVVTISGTPTSQGIHNYTVTTVGGACPPIQLNGVIEVNPTIVLSSAAGTDLQTVCEGDPIAAIVYTVGGGATGANATNLPAGVTQSFLGTDLTLSGTPTTAGVYNITVSTTGGPCPALSLPATITVEADHTILLSSAAGTDNQVVCETNALTDITFAIGGGATGAGATGLPAGVSGNFAAGTFTITGSPTTAGTYNFTVTTTGNGCDVATYNGTITVTTAPDATLTSAAGTDNQTICIGTPITSIEYTLVSPATGASVTGLPAGVSGNLVGGVFTISGTPTAAGLYPYVLTVSGGACPDQDINGVISVDDLNTLTLISAAGTDNQTICELDPIVDVVWTIGGGASGVTIDAPVPGGLSGNFAAGNLTVSGTPTGSGVINYSVSTTGGACPDATANASIIVSPQATLTLTSAAGTDNQTLCIDSALTAITYTMGGSADTITVTGLPTGVTSNYAAGTLTISGSTSLVGVHNFTVTAVSSICPNVVLNGTINISGPGTVTVDTPASDTQTVCINSAIVDIQYSFGGNATGLVVTGLPSGVTSNVVGSQMTISGTPSQGGTFNFIVTTLGSNCAPDTAYGQLVVQLNPVINLSSSILTAAQVVCEGESIDNIVFALSGGATTANVVSIPAGLVANQVGLTVTISGTPTTAGTYPYMITAPGGTCPDANFLLNLVVDENQILTLTSAPATDTQTVCINNAINDIVYQTSGGATSAVANGLPAGVSGVFAAGELTISGTPTAAGIFNYTVVSSGNPCDADTAYGQLIVEEVPGMNLTSALGTDGQTICQNEALTNIVYTLTGGATNVSASGLPAGVAGNLAAGVYTISGSPTTNGIFPYTLTATGTVCPSTNVVGTITIQTPATIASTTPLLDTQVVCINNAISDILFTYGGSAISATASGLPAGVTSNLVGSQLTLSGTPTSAGVFDYFVFTTGSVCPSDTAFGQLTVTDIPVINLTSVAGTDAQTICDNNPLTNIVYTLSGGATSAVTSGLPTGVAGNLSGTIYTLSGTPNGTGVYPYTITASGGACPDVVTTGTITVDDAPGLNLISALGTDAQSLCINTGITTVTYQLIGGATGVTESGLPPGVTGSIVAGNYVLTGIPTVAGTYNYTLTPTGGACPPVPVTGTITVQEIILNLVSPVYTNDQVVCIGDQIDTIQYEILGVPTVVDLPAGVTWTVIPGIPSILQITGSPTVSGAFFYTINLTGPCGFSSLIGSIKVVPAIVGNTSGVDQTICEGSNFTLVGGTLPVSPVPYNFLWQSGPSATGPFTPALGSNSSTDYTGTLNLGNPNRFFRRVVFVGGCSDTALVSEIFLDTLPNVVNVANKVLCSNDTLVLNDLIVSNGTIGGWTTTGLGQLLNAGTSVPTYIPGNIDAGSNVSLNYTVVSNNSCAPASITGSVQIQVLADPIAQAGGSATVCAFGGLVDLSGIALNGTPTWVHNGFGNLFNPNSTTAVYETVPSDTGTTIIAQLLVQNVGCLVPVVDTAIFTITVAPDGVDESINVNAGPDTLIHLGHNYQINATGNNVVKWIWTPTYGLSDSTVNNPLCSAEVNMTYILTGINEKGCYDRDTLNIEVSDEPMVFVPNLFSPNGDGINDYFEIPEIGSYPNTKMTIINREGVIVFSSDNYQNDWDGTYQGNKLPEATYYYLVEFANFEKVYKGAITILRNDNK